MGDNNRVQPALSERWEWISPQKIHFHLRKAFWENGDEITAQDFERSWKQALVSNEPLPLGQFLFTIKNGKECLKKTLDIQNFGVKALSNHLLEVELESPTPFFLELTTLPLFAPIHDKNTYLASGPYCLKNWKPQESLSLKKNALYWNASKTQTDSIEFSMIEDPTTEFSLFQKGELDWLGQPLSHEIPTEELEALKKNHLVQSAPVDGTLWIVCNTEKEPLNSPLLRRALSQAIDRQEIITHLLQGSQKPAFSPVPPSMGLDFVVTSPQTSHSAKELMQAFIQSHGPIPSLTLSFAPTARQMKIAQYLQQCWNQELGLNIKLETLEKNLLNAKEREGKLELSIGEWIADFHHPMAFLTLFEEKNGYLNASHWESKDYKNLVKEEKFVEAHQMLADQLPVIPVYHFSFDYVLSPSKIRRVSLSPLGIPDLVQINNEL